MEDTKNIVYESVERPSAFLSNHQCFSAGSQVGGPPFFFLNRSPIIFGDRFMDVKHFSMREL